MSFTKTGLALLLSTLAGVAMAADVQCNGSVSSLLIYTDGTVNILASWRSDYTHICNLKQVRKGVDPLTCAMWVNAIESARKLSATIKTYYTDDGSFTSCADLPRYAAAPAPVYFGH